MHHPINPTFAVKFIISGMKTSRFSLFVTTSILALSLLANTTQAQQKVKAAVIAFYNLENLFDTIDDPAKNDAEFLPSGANGWTSERYHFKLRNMAEVISQIGGDILPGGPTILGVSEIENELVLRDLIAMPLLANSGYDIVHYDSPDGRGVDVGLLYKKKDFTVLNSTSTRVIMPSDSGWRTRDQLCVTGLLDGETISIIVNHWPSRGNDEPYRLKAASVTRRIADSLYSIDPQAKIFIMGDLNDDPVDKSVAEVLGAVGKKSKLKEKGLFNPMWQLFHDGIGSLAYRDAWNLFDQIIISQPLTTEPQNGWRLHQARIFNKSFLIAREGQYAGYPLRTFSNGAFAGGYSDHLPAYLIIVKEKTQK